MVKLAAVVLGIPFFFKAARIAWCTVWSSLLHTWNVARGFSDDTIERLPFTTAKLYFDQQNDLHIQALV
jgi:hypothetical protein